MISGKSMLSNLTTGFGGSLTSVFTTGFLTPDLVVDFLVFVAQEITTTASNNILIKEFRRIVCKTKR